MFDSKGEYLFVNYASAKGAVLSLTQTQTLASEWAEKNVRVNAVIPGAFTKPQNIKSEMHKETLIQPIPMRKIGRPEDLIGAIQFLASNSSDYITG